MSELTLFMIFAISECIKAAKSLFMAYFWVEIAEIDQFFNKIWTKIDSNRSKTGRKWS